MQPGTPEFGPAFETWLLPELLALRDYASGEAIGYRRSTSGFEVDFVIGGHTAVEVKAKENVAERDLRSLRAIAEEKKLKRYVCVALEERRREVGEVSVVPWKEFLEGLWEGEFAA